MNLQLRNHQKEVYELMGKHNKMLTIAPTSAGKSYMMIADAKRRIEENNDCIILIISPKILLTQQLSQDFERFIPCDNIIHVHSGDTKHRKITDFLELAYWDEVTTGPKLIFSTYHSLHKIIKSEIHIDTVYLDEAHHAVNSRFFNSVKTISELTNNVFSLTATPKFSSVFNKPGNNDSDVFGSKIHNVSAPALINNGCILPPQAITIPLAAVRDSKDNPAERDFYTLLDCILGENHMNKVLICAPTTKVMMAMFAETDFLSEMKENGYEVLHITSKYGAFVDNKKVTRSEFLKTLSDYGQDDTKKFVVLHIGILVEGISVPGIQSCIMMRSTNMISTVQLIGRTIRVHSIDSERMATGELIPGDFDNYHKPFGKIVIPTYENGVGKRTANQVNHIVNEVFINGNYVYDEIKK